VPDTIDIPSKNNSRKDAANRKQVTWEILESLDSELTHKIKQLSEKWGYIDG